MKKVGGSQENYTDLKNIAIKYTESGGEYNKTALNLIFEKFNITINHLLNVDYDGKLLKAILTSETFSYLVPQIRQDTINRNPVLVDTIKTELAIEQKRPDVGLKPTMTFFEISGNEVKKKDSPLATYLSTSKGKPLDFDKVEMMMSIGCSGGERIKIGETATTAFDLALERATKDGATKEDREVFKVIFEKSSLEAKYTSGILENLIKTGTPELIAMIAPIVSEDLPLIKEFNKGKSGFEVLSDKPANKFLQDAVGPKPAVRNPTAQHPLGYEVGKHPNGQGRN